MFDDLSPARSGASPVDPPTNTAQVKAWAKQYWDLPDEATLMVSELQCGEADCPDRETVIAVLSVPGSNKSVKLNKGIASIKEADIQGIDIWKNPLA